MSTLVRVNQQNTKVLSQGIEQSIITRESTVKVARVQTGPQGLEGENLSSLGPRIDALELEDIQIKDDIGDATFDYSGYVQTLLS